MKQYISVILIALIVPSVALAQTIKVLAGTQKEDILKLSADTKPYILRGDYSIPAGKQLEIEQGTIVVAEKGAGISAAGTLLISGTQDAPVTFMSKVPGQASWEGIKIQKSDSSRIQFAIISGAKSGIYVSGCKPEITGCLLQRNTVGIKVGDYGAGGHPTVTNCVIANNNEDGIQLNASSANMSNCTIVQNGGWGIRGEYYASPKIERTIISKNKKGGLYCWLYTCKVEAHGCIIENNKNCNVQNGSPEDWDFSGNWWGKASTQKLIKSGDTANLPGILDGHDKENTGKVRLNEFLREPPKECGATLKFDPNQ